MAFLWIQLRDIKLAFELAGWVIRIAIIVEIVETVIQWFARVMAAIDLHWLSGGALYRVA